MTFVGCVLLQLCSVEGSNPALQTHSLVRLRPPPFLSEGPHIFICSPEKLLRVVEGERADRCRKRVQAWRRKRGAGNLKTAIRNASQENAVTVDSKPL